MKETPTLEKEHWFHHHFLQNQKDSPKWAMLKIKLILPWKHMHFIMLKPMLMHKEMPKRINIASTAKIKFV